MIEEFFYCVLCIILTSIVWAPLLAAYLIDKRSYKKDMEDKLTIKFSMFEHLYNLAPEKWDVYYESFVVYREPHQHTTLYFSRVDQKKYLKWRQRRANVETEKKKSERMTELVEMWQKDIEEYKEKYIHRPVLTPNYKAPPMPKCAPAKKEEADPFTFLDWMEQCKGTYFSFTIANIHDDRDRIYYKDNVVVDETSGISISRQLATYQDYFINTEYMIPEEIFAELKELAYEYDQYLLGLKMRRTI